MKIYLASSWRNLIQQEAVLALREIGHEVYDFKNPAPGNNGFGWSQIDPEWKTWDSATYRKALSHPIAVAGFKSDFDAMKWADAGVLLMPCGRSAHIEAGYFVGAGKPLYVVLSPGSEPELMYSMADGIFTDMPELLGYLKEYEPVR